MSLWDSCCSQRVHPLPPPFFDARREVLYYVYCAAEDDEFEDGCFQRNSTESPTCGNNEARLQSSRARRDRVGRARSWMLTSHRN